MDRAARLRNRGDVDDALAAIPYPGHTIAWHQELGLDPYEAGEQGPLIIGDTWKHDPEGDEYREEE